MKKKYGILLLILIICLQLFAVSAFASPSDIGEVSSQKMASFAQEVNNVYKIIVKIYLPIAAVTFAFTAFRMFFTVDGKTDREQMKLKKTLIYIVIATIALYILPLVINAGTTIGAKYQWVPPT